MNAEEIYEWSKFKKLRKSRIMIPETWAAVHKTDMPVRTQIPFKKQQLQIHVLWSLMNGLSIRPFIYQCATELGNRVIDAVDMTELHIRLL